MFITRTTRHDKGDVRELLEAHDWRLDSVDDGAAFIARDGEVVGTVRLVEVEPGLVVLCDMLVKESRRGQGIGREIMRAAMISRGGRLFVCCHEDVTGFYERFGFTEADPSEFPDEVANYFRKVGDLPPPDDHKHIYLTAR